MRANQFIENYDEEMIDEGLKQTMRNLGIAGVIGAGAALGLKTTGALDDYVKRQPATQNTTVSQALKNVIPIYNNHLEKVLYDTAVKYGLKGAELAQFMAQCAHESWRFTNLREKPNKLIPNYFDRMYDIKYNPKKAKELGNMYPGDGKLFRGGGFIQLTGRYNYTQAAKALDIPLDKKPELIEDPKVAALVSVWYWNQRVKPSVSDFSDTESVTKKINKKLKGLSDRVDKFTRYLSADVAAK